MKIPLGFGVTLIALFMTCAQAETISFEGTWSAPSLSQPDTPIIFALLPGGKATEQIAAYRGTGRWKVENGAARISWASEWIGLLRPKAEGGFELLTWKKGSAPDGPPDDTQPARRIEASKK